MQLQSNAIKLLQLKIKQMCSQTAWLGDGSEGGEGSIMERKVWRGSFCSRQVLSALLTVSLLEMLSFH